MKKLAQFILGSPAVLAAIALFAAAEANAAPQWTNGTAVDCSKFTPSEDNLLRNKFVSFTMAGNEIAEHHRLYSHVVTWTNYKSPDPKASDGNINLARYNESIWLKDKSALTDGDASFAGVVSVGATSYPQPVGFKTTENAVLLYNSPAYPVHDNAVAIFSFPGRATVRSLKVYAWWADNGRNQPQIGSVEAFVDGEWTTIANSALTGSAVNDAKKLPNATLADSALGYLAKGVSAIRINFGAQQANEAGYAEIEANGEWEGEWVAVKSIPDHPEWGYKVDYAQGGHDYYTAYVYTNTTAEMSFTVPDNVTAYDFLVVGGGGSGGGSQMSGGGGGGGVITGRVTSVTGRSVSVKVGRGGVGTASTEESGADSTIAVNGATLASSSLVAKGGGHGGRWVDPGPYTDSLAGGSGGGAYWDFNLGEETRSSTQTKTFDIAGVTAVGFGGNGAQNTSKNGGRAGGGGGATADAVNPGSDSSLGGWGNGGEGLSCDITGTAVVYGSGGGGGAHDAYNGSGGTNAGSGGSHTPDVAATSGVDGTGGGGGGSSGDAASNLPGNGGSGVVVIRYATPNTPIPDHPEWGYVRTYALDGKNCTAYVYTNTAETTTMSFTVPAGVTSLDYLVIGGGGGGGYTSGGGGGAGGCLEGTLTSLAASYEIKVGGGGAGGKTQTEANDWGRGGSGSNSSLATITAIGGGGGAAYLSAGHPPMKAGTPMGGLPGGSGGGGAAGGNNSTGCPASPWNYTNPAGSGTSGQGYDGGAGYKEETNGGGGGAGGPGGYSTTANGAGGPGRKSTITGAECWYAGGGGAAQFSENDIPPAKGSNGGGDGSLKGGVGGNATTLGSGGGGGGGAGGGTGAAGVVIVRYALALQVTLYQTDSGDVKIGTYDTISAAVEAAKDASGTKFRVEIPASEWTESGTLTVSKEIVFSAAGATVTGGAAMTTKKNVTFDGGTFAFGVLTPGGDTSTICITNAQLMASFADGTPSDPMNVIIDLGEFNRKLFANPEEGLERTSAAWVSTSSFNLSEGSSLTVNAKGLGVGTYPLVRAQGLDWDAAIQNAVITVDENLRGIVRYSIKDGAINGVDLVIFHKGLILSFGPAN